MAGDIRGPWWVGFLVADGVTATVQFIGGPPTQAGIRHLIRFINLTIEGLEQDRTLALNQEQEAESPPPLSQEEVDDGQPRDAMAER